MTNDEINKYIHEQIMDGCVNFQGINVDVACDQCGYEAINHAFHIPDYCSDDSPRSLLNEVVAKISGEPQSDRAMNLISALADATGRTRLSDALTATAAQIARACVEAHKEAK